MDAIFLSRIQFAVAAGFHFLFPPMTLGITLIILILETLYIKRGEEIYKNVSGFLIKILGLIFVVGTATGIVLEFSFGTNWSEYSRMVGDIFGAPLAAEGIFSFFLESVFLGVLLFARKKISKRAYWFSAVFVFLGSHLSGLWIIIANSWMQTPAGYEIINGRAVLTDFFAAALNHSTIFRYIHVVIASWITGSLMVAGIAAYYLIKKKFTDSAKIYLRVALVIFIAASLIQLGSGHSHSVQVGKTQPEKMAAYQALVETQEGAPLSVFGLPIGELDEEYLNLGIPKMLSFLIYGDFDAPVKGLKDFPEDERPPVFLSFASYHTMVGLGFIFITLSVIGLYLLIKKKVWDTKWYLKLLILAVPLPHLANEFGWIGAEVGRQPWAVYHVLRTADAVSIVVPAGQILFSLIMFSLIYLFIGAVFLIVLLKFIKKGPESLQVEGY